MEIINKYIKVISFTSETCVKNNKLNRIKMVINNNNTYGNVDKHTNIMIK